MRAMIPCAAASVDVYEGFYRQLSIKRATNIKHLQQDTKIVKVLIIYYYKQKLYVNK